MIARVGRIARCAGLALYAAAFSALASSGASGAPLPTGAAILPPPPPPRSAAATLDGQVFLDTRAIRQQDPARWAQAAMDSRLDGDRLPAAFAEALGMNLDPARTPLLHRLLDHAARGIAPSVHDAQAHFRRKRPYRYNHQSICVARFTALDRSPSYPSADAALGWGAALILAELAPDRAERILARGRELGEERVVCGVIWRSDAQAATLYAAALVAALHGDPAFRDELQRARQELHAATPG